MAALREGDRDRDGEERRINSDTHVPNLIPQAPVNEGEIYLLTEAEKTALKKRIKNPRFEFDEETVTLTREFKILTGLAYFAVMKYVKDHGFDSHPSVTNLSGRVNGPIQTAKCFQVTLNSGQTITQTVTGKVPDFAKRETQLKVYSLPLIHLRDPEIQDRQAVADEVCRAVAFESGFEAINAKNWSDPRIILDKSNPKVSYILIRHSRKRDFALKLKPEGFEIDDWSKVKFSGVELIFLPSPLVGEWDNDIESSKARVLR